MTTNCRDAETGWKSFDPIDHGEQAAYCDGDLRQRPEPGRVRSGWHVALTTCRTCCCESPCCRSVEECCRFPPPFFCFMFPHLSRTFPVADHAPCDRASDGELFACDWESGNTWKGCDDGDSAEPGAARRSCNRRWRNDKDCATGGAAVYRKPPIWEHLARLCSTNRGGFYETPPHLPPAWSFGSKPAGPEVQRGGVTASGGAREAQFLFALELFHSDSRERINKPMIRLMSRDDYDDGDATFATAGDAAFERGWSEEVWRHDPILSCCVSAVHCLTRLLDATLVSSNVLLSKSLTSAWSTHKRSKEQAERSGGWRWRKAARKVG